MNLDLRNTARHLGLLMFVLSALVGAAAGFAGWDHAFAGHADTADIRALSATILIGVVVGGLLVFVGRGKAHMLGQREALLLVAASWLLGAVIAAMPYRVWSSLRPDAQVTAHSFDTFVNCYFEAMSGLTTTGATVVESIGTLPRSLLLWRAMTHWLGGLGIVVLFVAVLPLLGVGGRRVYRIEAPGPTPEGAMPRIQDTARILWFIYLGLTVAEVAALKLCGMDVFDAVCHTMGTLATGGFSTLDSSVAGFSSTAIHLVIIAFMVLAGINFGLYHQLLHRQWRSVLKDSELRAYLAIMFVATVIVTVCMLRAGQHVAAGGSQPAPVGLTVRDSLFQVVSIQTTTGFCTADFDAWGFTAKATLLILMFIGASAGSTGGGIKVVRILIAAKVILAEVEQVYRPKIVRTVKIGKAVIDPDLKRSTLAYVLSIAILFAIGTALLMFFESEGGVDITTAATASAATLNNIGPGLARVGATQNYAWFGASSKIVMCVLMPLGRLEMFAILVLFSPRFWRVE
ncbi:MAG: TrkH family potassium uptake protein [Phycisphaerales bacterium]|nr:MAG: TrkH family potassium uptake protein [Phycisphaerales bacterium]